MKLLRHELKNYRNIEALVFSPVDGVNVVCGENGQGKTNLIESVFLLTGAKSFRGGKDENLIKSGESAAAISADFFCEGREQKIKLRIDSDGRTASLNEGTWAKAAALAGRFCCVVFSPEHLLLVKGAPELRRKLIDSALCQISNGYLANLKKYRRLLLQKNSLLKDSRYVSAAYDMLDVYDAGIAAAAAAVTEKRREYIAALAPEAARFYSEISDNREALDIKYQSSLFKDSTSGEAEAYDLLRRLRADDMKAGFCTAGPHRDDIYISLAGEDAKLFASQGQQRCAVLAMKLAESELLERALGEKPVLLLDDVMSELDENRRDYLVASLSGRQSVITCCAPELVCGRTKAEVFAMDAGRLL